MIGKCVILISCVIIAGCSNTVTVDNYCARTERGTIHRDDTPKTQRWMYRYEVMRQRTCLQK